MCKSVKSGSCGANPLLPVYCRKSCGLCSDGSPPKPPSPPVTFWMPSDSSDECGQSTVPGNVVKQANDYARKKSPPLKVGTYAVKVKGFAGMQTLLPAATGAPAEIQMQAADAEQERAQARLGLLLQRGLQEVLRQVLRRLRRRRAGAIEIACLLLKIACLLL